LLVHILDTALVRVSPEAYNTIMASYKTPLMGLGEIALVGAVVFHALNGLRIIAIDYWRKGVKYQRVMFWTVVGVWVVLMAAFVPRQIIMILSEVQG
jgi:succinate dehydrogenase / fumarate reductase cytochrome b subunit